MEQNLLFICSLKCTEKVSQKNRTEIEKSHILYSCSVMMKWKRGKEGKVEVVLCGFVLNRNETAEAEIENVSAFVHSSGSFKAGKIEKFYELLSGLPDQSPARPERAEPSGL